MADFSFAIAAGWNVAQPTNVEDLTATFEAPGVLPDRLVPFRGALKRRAMSGKARRDGAITFDWFWPSMLVTDYNTLVSNVWTSVTTESVKATIVTLDEQTNYARYNVYAEQPIVGETYTLAAGGVYKVDVAVTFFAVQRLQPFSSGFSDGFEKVSYG